MLKPISSDSAPPWPRPLRQAARPNPGLIAGPIGLKLSEGNANGRS